MSSAHSDLAELIARIMADAKNRGEITAREAGFDSLDAYEAHQAEVERKAQEAAKAQELERHRRRLLAQVRGQLTKPIEAAMASGGPLEATQALRGTQEWLSTPRPFLVLSGGTGTGKTVAAVWAMVTRFSDSQFVRAARIGPHYERWSSDREDKIEPLDIDAGLLIVDDLGMESLEDRRSMLALEAIANDRQIPERRTIFTTNLDLDGIRHRYGHDSRFISRLTQGATVVTLSGSDMRRRQR